MVKTLNESAKVLLQQLTKISTDTLVGGNVGLQKMCQVPRDVKERETASITELLYNVLVITILYFYSLMSVRVLGCVHVSVY